MSEDGFCKDDQCSDGNRGCRRGKAIAQARVASGERCRLTARLGRSIGDPTELPQPAVGRLSLYYRELRRLLESGTTSLNSQELGRIVDVSSAVVRRDLSAFGTIGRREGGL